MERGLYSFICCGGAESRSAIVNSGMWPIPLTAIGHLLLMKNLWSEGGAAVTPNVMLSHFFPHNHKPCRSICWTVVLAWHLMCRVLQLVTHICRHGGNDVVHRGTNISLILHLGSGTGWQEEKVIQYMRALIRINRLAL